MAIPSLAPCLCMVALLSRAVSEPSPSCHSSAVAGTHPQGACTEDADGASALQVQSDRSSDNVESQRSEHPEIANRLTDRRREPIAALAIADESARARQKANQTSGAIITTDNVVLSTAMGVLSHEVIVQIVKLAFSYLTGPDDFQHAVGPFGLPLSFGVINDTPEPVLYSEFQLLDGAAWGHPALYNQLKPGEMMQWFLYTETTKVEATMLFKSGDRTWSVAVAQLRTGSWFTGCDRLRCNVVPGSNKAAALDELCRSDGGARGAGIRKQGSYKLTLLLNEALQRQGSPAASEAKEADVPAQLPKRPLEVDNAVTEGGRKFVIAATVITAAVGFVASAAVNRAFDYFSGWSEFEWAVGFTGLPLTLGVINDTPEPVQYADFALGSGTAWGYPAIKDHIAPGEMMQWFLYTQTTAVEATMLFQASGGKNWSVGVAQYRYVNMFSECDRLRSKAMLGSDMAATLVGMCESDGGNREAIYVQGGYQLIVQLGKI